MGLSQAQDIDQELAEDWLALLARQDADHTLAWRRLADAAEGQDQTLTQLFNDPAAAAPWLARWRQRLDAEPQAATERAAALRQANPLYIPRNHLVEEALAAASDHGDMGPTQALLDVLRQPYTERAGLERYTQPAAPEVAQGYRTVCGT
ncbi:hypothetical protein C3F00_041340 [Pseudomonas sp. MWU13-2860]|nr:hypothetical protein C3F00_041340 [Pseudomonas sp. MWU13-2860]